ncbi:MAG: DUF456 domain-containing protein [Pirellulaceae bacterium]
MVYVWAVILLLANGVAWLSNVFTLPGNWVLVAFSLLYALLLPEDMTPRVSLTMVAVIFGLAVLGEIVEFIAGAAGAAQQGGNRKGMALAVVGAFVGSIVGAILLAWLPILGTIIGALGGGSVGAFAGAWAGELGSQRTHAERYHIGRGAAIGRLLGTAGKMAIGAIMLVLVTFDSFYDFGRNEPEIVPNSPREVNAVSGREMPSRNVYEEPRTKNDEQRTSLAASFQRGTYNLSAYRRRSNKRNA